MTLKISKTLSPGAIVGGRWYASDFLASGSAWVSLIDRSWFVRRSLAWWSLNFCFCSARISARDISCSWPQVKIVLSLIQTAPGTPSAPHWQNGLCYQVILHSGSLILYVPKICSNHMHKSHQVLHFNDSTNSHVSHQVGEDKLNKPMATNVTHCLLALSVSQTHDSLHLPSKNCNRHFHAGSKLKTMNLSGYFQPINPVSKYGNMQTWTNFQTC